ncbi:MAG: hypothetical protein V8T31_06305 [Lachnospiraceae bacterium]
MGNLSKQSGIYAIVNIMDNKVYVGQAKEFNNRDHFLQLKKGNDTKRLQADYDREKELVYFVLGNLNQETEWNDTDLDSFEKMYMTIFEDLQFELYNCNIQRKDREIESLEDFVKEQYHSAVESLNNDFLMRFEVKAKDVPKLTEGEKKEMLKKYARNRLEHQVETSDRFFFNRNRIEKIINNTMPLEELESLNLDEFFFHKVGNYLNEGIDQIIYDKNQIIKDNKDNKDNKKYCLWAFAANAVNAETVRSLCRERAKHHTDTYVLFSVTPSSKYASSKSHKQSVLKGKDCKDLATDEIAFLNLQEVGKKDYKVPNAVACTAKSSTSANAFVIQKISLIDGDIEKSKLAENYLAVKESGNLYQHTKRKVCSTFYMRSNKKLHDNKALFETPDNKSFCFLGKLAAPYVIKLTGQEKEFINILRSYGITEYWCSKGFDPGADEPCGELLLPTGHSGCAARVYDLFNETDTMRVDVRTAVEGPEAFHKLAGELEHRRL